VFALEANREIHRETYVLKFLFSRDESTLRRRPSLIAGAAVFCARLAVLLLAVVLAGGGLQAWAGEAAGSRHVDPTELFKTAPIPENVLGSASAPVTIVEYSSLTCPHCARFHSDVLPTLKQKYIEAGKVRYILREYPLDNLAMAGFMVARCVDRDRFFAFVDLLYAKQDNWAHRTTDPQGALRMLAKQAGLGDDRFKACLQEQTMLDGLTWVKNHGEGLGVSSTPTFFINGVEFKGEFTVNQMDGILEPYLKK
jgi:protein-disulfide isomerase